MNKLILVAISVCMTLWGCVHSPEGHSSRDSLDWAGIYAGILPCADCPGIHTTMTLNPDQTYVRVTRYEERKDGTFEQKGVFSWSPDGSAIILDDEKSPAYKVGENALFHLDMAGQVIIGDLAESYVLRKQPAMPLDLTGKCILDTRWRLVELFGKPVAENTRFPFILLDAQAGRISGFGGCNSISGSYELKAGKRIRFTNMASTMMACPDMDTEQEFFNVLAMTDNFACNGKTLFLHKARMAPLARFEAVP
ncbi:MAG: hypothetical protein CVU60_16025 [Deltaproteobacteria bacterium HGW-Deltaproteobacteria-18]|jgi:heat shock protein HslJ|nr:MAG: hypothetical protein CVU60_16025 [Deltaproteobacteria bacterium HGW-Deltaproteobacteria-18]